MIEGSANTKGLKHLRRTMRNDLRRHSRGPLKQGFRVIAKIYEARIRRRFIKEGEGDWPPHAESTKAARRKGKGKGVSKSRTSGKLSKRDSRSAIKLMRDDGLLLQGLTIGADGNLFEDIVGGVVYGYSNAKHADDNVTYRELAVWHGKGAGNLPVRKIIIAPPRDVIPRMKRAQRQAWRNALRQARTALGGRQ